MLLNRNENQRQKSETIKKDQRKNRTGIFHTRKYLRNIQTKRNQVNKNWKETSRNASHKNVKYHREKFRKEVKAAKNYASKSALEIRVEKKLLNNLSGENTLEKFTKMDKQ